MDKKLLLNNIDHLVLLIRDLKITEQFYSIFLGKPIHKDKFQIAYEIGNTKLFFAKSNRNIKFDKENIGLNHLAFGVSTINELKEFENTLKKYKINNSNIKIDKYGKKPFIWFDDPDGIRLEFYLRN